MLHSLLLDFDGIPLRIYEQMSCQNCAMSARSRRQTPHSRKPVFSDMSQLYRRTICPRRMRADALCGHATTRLARKRIFAFSNAFCEFPYAGTIAIIACARARSRRHGRLDMPRKESRCARSGSSRVSPPVCRPSAPVPGPGESFWSPCGLRAQLCRPPDDRGAGIRNARPCPLPLALNCRAGRGLGPGVDRLAPEHGLPPVPGTGGLAEMAWCPPTAACPSPTHGLRPGRRLPGGLWHQPSGACAPRAPATGRDAAGAGRGGRRGTDGGGDRQAHGRHG